MNASDVPQNVCGCCNEPIPNHATTRGNNVPFCGSCDEAGCWRDNIGKPCRLLDMVQHVPVFGSTEAADQWMKGIRP